MVLVLRSHYAECQWSSQSFPQIQMMLISALSSSNNLVTAWIKWSSLWWEAHSWLCLRNTGTISSVTYTTRCQDTHLTMWRRQSGTKLHNKPIIRMESEHTFHCINCKRWKWSRKLSPLAHNAEYGLMCWSFYEIDFEMSSYHEMLL